MHLALLAPHVLASCRLKHRVTSADGTKVYDASLPHWAHRAAAAPAAAAVYQDEVPGKAGEVPVATHEGEKICRRARVAFAPPAAGSYLHEVLLVRDVRGAMHAQVRECSFGV